MADAEEWTPEMLRRGIRATENLDRWSFRFSAWMGDRAVAAEPITDENDSTWPTRPRSWLWSTVAMYVQEYWNWRWVR